MKMKKICLMSIISIVAGLCISIGFKQNIKDMGIAAIQNIEDIRALDCNANQIFTEADVKLFIADAGSKHGNLSEDVEIYVVTPTNKITQYNFTMLQEVEITETIRGGGTKNDRIQIVTAGGIYDQKYRYYDYTNDRPVYYGMTNILLPGNKYLVFLEQLKINRYTECKRYNLAMPLFSTFNITSDYSKPVNKPVSEISYNEYGDSEYLCDTSDTIECLLNFKHSILDIYLK